jgi:hypothetical protein
MSGKGGSKHRQMGLHHKRMQEKAKGQASVARAKGIFEAKGQAWDPENNPQQMGALNHAGRRLVARKEIDLR